MPWSNSVSQDRLWKIRIISCPWVTSLNKKAAFVQVSLRLWGFACRHHFLTSGREMQILRSPHIESQPDLRFNRNTWFESNLFGLWVNYYFLKTTTECQTVPLQDVWKCICRLWWEGKWFSYETLCAGKKSYSVNLQEEKWDRRMVSFG